MSIKGGDLLTIGNKILIHRLQTAGAGTVDVPKDRVYELGNFRSVGTVYGIPNLSFPCEAVDASHHMEALLLGRPFDPVTGLNGDADGTEYLIANSKPMDVAQLFKAGKTATNPYDIVGGVAIPYLTLESLSYRFGLDQSASQTMTLRGDSIIYAPGPVYVEEFTAGPFTLANDALPNGDIVGTTRYVLGASLAVSGKRLIKDTDFTETVGGAGAGSRPVTIDLTPMGGLPAGETLRVVYASDAPTTMPQAAHTAPPATAPRPAAIRGRDIQVFVGGTALTDRWVGVQAVTADYRVTLLRDEEFGNPNILSQDYDVPSVTGSIDLKPRDPAELIDRVKQIAGVTSASESVGVLRQVALPLDIVLHSPEDGSVLKTLHVPDARFTVPGFSGRVQQKQVVTFAFESDGGDLRVYKGPR